MSPKALKTRSKGGKGTKKRDKKKLAFQVPIDYILSFNLLLRYLYFALGKLEWISITYDLENLH